MKQTKNMYYEGRRRQGARAGRAEAHPGSSQKYIFLLLVVLLLLYIYKAHTV